MNKDNNKITELRTILQRESPKWKCYLLYCGHHCSHWCVLGSMHNSQIQHVNFTVNIIMAFLLKIWGHKAMTGQLTCLVYTGACKQGSKRLFLPQIMPKNYSLNANLPSMLSTNLTHTETCSWVETSVASSPIKAKNSALLQDWTITMFRLIAIDFSQKSPHFSLWALWKRSHFSL
jgi:hypothetical protein